MEKILAFTERQQIAKDVVATMKDALSEDPSKRIGIEEAAAFFVFATSSEGKGRKHRLH